VSLDRDGCVMSWNRGAEQLFGLSSSEVRGMALAPRFDEPAAFVQAFELALRGGGRTFEFTFARPTCEQHFEATFDRIADATGGSLGLVMILRDVTERRQAEDALKRDHQQKDEFLAMLGHELRNPLGAIRSAAAVLNRMQLDDPRACGAVDVLIRQSSLMAGLVDDLLDIARVTRGSLHLDLRPVPIADVIADALEQSRVLIDAKGQHVETRTAQTASHVVGDRRRLVQVFANLLTNSSKYTDEGGRISVSVDADEEQVRVTVADDGIGISCELLPRVFDLFTQADGAAERSRGGLGIGLALVRGLVARHGGTVTADSPGLGQGSAFAVTLPRSMLIERPG
jgi:PAS domain S-box-containing protein